MKKLLHLTVFCFLLSQLSKAQLEYLPVERPMEAKPLNESISLRRLNYSANWNPAISNTRKSFSKTSGAVMLIDSAYTWDNWDTINLKFKTNASSKMATVVYNASNQCIMSITQIWNGTKWINDGKHLFTYNANGKYATQSSQNWSGTAWVDFDKSTYTYDAKNNMTNVLSQNWGGTTWIDNFRVAYTFDGNNNELSYFGENWNGTAWVNSIKEAYTYDVNNNMTNKLSQSWSGTAWKNSLNVLYTYNANKKVASQTMQTWGTSWTDNSKETYTYDANLNLSTQLRQDWISAQWKDIERYTYLYDINNNQINYTQVLLYGTSWLNAAKASFTYDVNNFMLSSVYKLYNAAGTKITIGDSNYTYFHTAVAGINKSMNAGNGIQVSPNPFTSLTMVSFTEGIENGVIKLFDMQGNEVRSINFSGNQLKIEKGELRAGIYFLVVTDENNHVTGRKLILD